MIKINTSPTVIATFATANISAFCKSGSDLDALLQEAVTNTGSNTGSGTDSSTSDSSGIASEVASISTASTSSVQATAKSGSDSKAKPQK